MEDFETFLHDFGGSNNNYNRIEQSIYRRSDGSNKGAFRQEDRRHYTTLLETKIEDLNKRLRFLVFVYSSIAWRALVLISVAICYVLDTVIYTFNETNDRSFWAIIIIICLNLIFTLDVLFMIGLKCFSKWNKKLNIIEPSTKVVVFNILLAVPYPFLYFVSYKTVGFDYHIIIPIASIARGYRMIEYFYVKSSQAGSDQWNMFFFQYLILFLISVHTWTCVWYLFSYRDFDIHRMRSSWSMTVNYLPTETTFDWYLVCMYWSIMFLTTNALGDLYPLTTTERISSTLAILLGFHLTTLVFVGSLTSQFITMTTRRSKYAQKMKKVLSHLKLINMDKDTTDRIIRYYKDLWNQKSGVFKPKLFTLLPFPLQTEISYDLNAVPLYSSLIFRKLPESFLRAISLAMSHQFYLPDDIVYNHNQTKTCMICITAGVLELLSDEDDESPMISFTKGTVLGEISLLYNIPARCTVKAATYVECQVLEKTDFMKLIVTYPDILLEIREVMEARILKARERKISAKDSVLSLNIFASNLRSKSSIKMLKDQLRYVQGRLPKDPLSEQDNLDTSCLDLYILNERVKKQDEVFMFLNKTFPWILVHNCQFVYIWNIYMIAVAVYVCAVYPYFISYSRKTPSGVFLYIERAVLCSLILNFIITCTTAVKTKRKYLSTIKEIVKYRINTLGFYLDVVAMIPFENLVSIRSHAGYRDDYNEHLYYVFKISKLCLVWRISHVFEELGKRLLYNTILTKVIKYSVYLVMVCYWCGGVLYIEACFVERCSSNSWFSLALAWSSGKNESENLISHPYVTSIYFATTLLLSVSFGDFVPGDHFDMALVAFLCLYGVLFIGFCVAEFSAVITHWSRTSTSFLEVVITMDKFMKENNIKHCIKSRIMAFYDLQWQYNSGVELTGDHWLETTVVPTELKKKVLHQARFKALTSINFFQVKNKAFIQTLTEKATEIILPPGEIVNYGGTVSRELYIIENGYCLITPTSESKKPRVIGPGNHLGLISLLYGVPASNTVVTLTHCKLISIDYGAYTSALSLFPMMREHDHLLTFCELKIMEEQAKSENHDPMAIASKYMYYETERKQRIEHRITSLLQTFFHKSFIHVGKEYARRGDSYKASYKQFGTFSTFARYLLFPIAIKPHGWFLKVWALFRVFTAFVLCLIIPLAVSMGPACNTFNIPIIFFEVVCYIDLYMMMHVAYYGSMNQLIYHPFMTAKNYIKGAFCLELLTSFPWYAVVELISPSHNDFHDVREGQNGNSHFYTCIVRMINALQIYKIYTVFWTDSVKELKRAYLMSVVQFFLITVFFLNLYTSILLMLTCSYIAADDKVEYYEKCAKLNAQNQYMIPRQYSKQGNFLCYKDSWIDMAKFVKHNSLTPKHVYLLALYWTVSSFSGAGFGDITAHDTTHMLLTICVSLHGVMFFGYVYAKIASLKATSDQVVTKFQENMKHLEMFFSRENICPALKNTVISFWKYQWKRTGGWSHQSILGKLHANLNEDAVLHMYERTLREIPLFEGVESSFFRAFAKMLKEGYFQKGYQVVCSNDVIANMYIIYRGKVDVMSQYNEIETTMGPGAIFGNIKGTAMCKTKSNIVCTRNTDLLNIKGTDFFSLLKSYPSVLKKVRSVLDSATKDYVNSTVGNFSDSDILNPVPLSYEDEEEMDQTDLEYDNNDTGDSFKASVKRYGRRKVSGSIDNLFSMIFSTTYVKISQKNIRKFQSDKSLGDSHMSRSNLSLGNADYTRSYLLLFIVHRWFRTSTIPDCKFISFMDSLIVVLSYIDFVFQIYKMAFFTHDEYYFYFCMTSDVLFLYKIFLDMHTGYINRYGDYVLEPPKVRAMFFSKVYLRRRDFLANLPLCYIALAMPLRKNMSSALFCYMRTPQLSRISHVFTYRTNKKINIGSGNLLVKLTSIAIWASIMSHVSACLFFKLSCLTPVQCLSSNWINKHEICLKSEYLQKKYFSLYVAALWYIINLLTITGTGDVSAQNDFEVMETIIIVIVIKFCTGLLISEMSAMITEHSSSRIEYDYGITELRDGFRDMGLSEHQMNKMWDYVKQLWSRQQGKQTPELIVRLPFRLRSQVMIEIYGRHLRDSMIFSNSGDDFIKMVCMWLRQCVFFPGNYIVQSGDADQCIYFIHRGEVEVLTVHLNMTESVYDILGPDDCFGIAQGLFLGVSHHFSFRARTTVDIIYLKLENWKYLLDFFPRAAKIVKRQVENIYLAT